jgi:hypothetical protein
MDKKMNEGITLPRCDRLEFTYTKIEKEFEMRE